MPSQSHLMLYTLFVIGLCRCKRLSPSGRGFPNTAAYFQATQLQRLSARAASGERHLPRGFSGPEPSFVWSLVGSSAMSKSRACPMSRPGRSSAGEPGAESTLCRSLPNSYVYKRDKSKSSTPKLVRQSSASLPQVGMKSSPKSSPVITRSTSLKFLDKRTLYWSPNLTRRSMVVREEEQLFATSSDTECTMEETGSKRQSYRIKTRRGAVTSQLSPASSEASIESGGDYADDSPTSVSGNSTTTWGLGSTSAPWSPQRQRAKTNEERTGWSRPVSLIHRPHSTISADVTPNLAAVAAVHLQGFIEASAQGLESPVESEHAEGRTIAAVIKRNISSKIRKKFGRQESFGSDDIKALFTNFKIHDTENYEFAVYKDKVWKDFMEWSTGIPAGSQLDDVGEAEAKRRDKVWELFRSECVFLVDHMLVLKEIFQERLRWLQCEGHLMHIEVAKLFANVDELCTVSAEFCHDLVTGLCPTSDPLQFGRTDDILAAFATFSTRVCPAYCRYCMNYAGALQYLETLKKQEDFMEFCKLCERDRRCKRLQLADFLITPIQRITKYTLLLRDIQHSTCDMAQRTTIGKTLESVHRDIGELESKVQWLSNFERMRELQQMIIWPSSQDQDTQNQDGLNRGTPWENIFASTSRSLIHEGPLTLCEDGKLSDMYAFLFGDMFLLTRLQKVKRRSNQHISIGSPIAIGRSRRSFSPPRPGHGVCFLVEQTPISLHELEENDAKPDAAANKQVNRFIIVSVAQLGKVCEVYTFQCPSESAKKSWLTHLHETKMKWMQTHCNTLKETDF